MKRCSECGHFPRSHTRYGRKTCWGRGNNCGCARFRMYAGLVSVKRSGLFCPYCGHVKLWKAGFTAKGVLRYKCLWCLRLHTVSKPGFRQHGGTPFRKYTFEESEFLVEKILDLSRSDKGYVKKYDPFKKSTYSTREIASLLGVGKSTVAKWVKANPSASAK